MSLLTPDECDSGMKVCPSGDLSVSTELVKVAGVAPTEMQELGGGSQSQPTTQPPS